MSCTAHFADELRSRGYRMTPQRLAILHILHESGQHLSPAQVYEHARASTPGLTEATVYRTLEFLAENGLAMPAHVGSGRLVYQISGHAHHHLICNACGSSVEVSHDQLEKFYDRLEDLSGFRLTGRHATFFGLCPDCRSD